MANFTSADVMKLREQTGVGMMDCKKALVETDGNFDEAVKYLREKGMASAAKKASRVAAEGLVKCVVSADKKSAVAVEINCETDFVARSDQFIALIDNIADHLLASNAANVEAALEEPYLGDKSKTLNVLIAEATAQIGEKISLRRFTKYVLNGNGLVASYIHMGGKIGVLCEVESNAKTDALQELAFNLCMQIAASKPQVVSIADVDASNLDSEREILTAQAKNEGKPDAVIAKMVEGRIHKYYKEVCLLEQEYVRDSALAVKNVIAECEKATGASVKVNRFVRYEMGEGIEKRHDNFADEIAAQLKGVQ
ncbi:MAG: translation elongation factor Ts [Corallococcus sp.]|nr:translation elongation factor Ts [Corallococcus sp.]MCM1359738.1 translation elongation factor Ts [Corallococcus sp.]MCM1395447.1 translation elongation factor Ts [Corallococcus sp.]